MKRIDNPNYPRGFYLIGDNPVEDARIEAFFPDCVYNAKKAGHEATDLVVLPFADPEERMEEMPDYMLDFSNVQ